MNNKKGITLIALVVSIIILLILSGISLSLTIGDNGLISKTLNSKKQEQLSNIEAEVTGAVKRLEYYNVASSDVGRNIFSLSNIANLRKYLEGKINGIYQRANGNVVMYYDKDNVSYTVEINTNGRVIAKEGTILFNDFTTPQIIEMPTGSKKTFSSPYEETIWVVIDPNTREIITNINIASIDPITGELIKNTDEDVIVRGYDKSDTTNNTYVDIKVVDNLPIEPEIALGKIKDQIDDGRVIGNGGLDQINESDPDDLSSVSEDQKPELKEDDTIIYRLGDNVYGAIVDKNSSTYTFEVFIHNEGDGILIPISDEVYTDNKIDIKENTLIKKLIIDEGVKELLPEVFINFVNVEYLSIPTTITTFGKYLSPFASNSTTGMNNVKTLMYNAINISGSTSTNSNMFGYTNANNVIIGDKVEVIPNCFMLNNNSLSELIIPGNVKKTNSYAFYKCENLEKLVLNEGIEELGQDSFSYSAIKRIVIPNSLIKIGMNAFYENTQLGTVIMGNSVSTISSCAFYDCVSLKEFTIPESVTLIGSRALGKCKNIETINYNATNAKYNSGGLNEKYGVATGMLDCNSFTTTSTGASSGNFDTMQPEFLQKSVPYYENSPSHQYLNYSHSRGHYVEAGSTYTAYESYTSTVSVSTPKVSSETREYTYYVNEANDYSTNDTYTYYVKENGEYVPHTTTKDLLHTGIKTVQKKGSYTTQVLKHETKTVSVTRYRQVQKTAQSRTYVSSPTIQNYSSSSSSYPHYYSQKTLRGFIYSIRNYDYDYNNLKRINIGNNVKVIPNSIFSECTKLTNINIPPSVETIEDYAFCSCTGLKNITFNNGIKSIGKKSFKKCVALTRLEIPDTIESIGALAFEECFKVNILKMQHTLDGETWGLVPDTKAGTQKYVFHESNKTVSAPGVRIEYEE